MTKSKKTKNRRKRPTSRSRSRSKSKSAGHYGAQSNKALSQQKKLVLNMLREFKWPKTERNNVLRPGQIAYEGFALGIVTSWAGKGEKSGYRKVLSLKTQEPKYKSLFKETKKLMKLGDPSFKFTSVQYNKNHRAARHVDAKNTGVSYIIGLGKYTGGELLIYDENEKNPKKYNIRNRFYTFDGSKYPHETAPFKGERYTLVFYST